MGSGDKQKAGVAPRATANVTFVVKNKNGGQPVRGVQFRGDTVDTLDGARAERQWPDSGRTGPSGKIQINFLVGNLFVLLRLPLGGNAVGLPRFASDRNFAVVHNGPITEGKHTITVLIDWTPEGKVSWEPVTNANFLVGGLAGDEKPFAQWFNAVVRQANPTDFPHKLNEAGFTDTFDNCALWGQPQLTGREFIAFLMIMYNETGGTIASQIEPSNKEDLQAVAFCFERRALKNGGSKMGYNRVSGNRKAGDQLRNRPALPRPLTDAEVALWNGEGSLPPDEPSGIRRECKNADFWKYRGHGLMQITGRAVFRICAAVPLGVHFGIPGAATATSNDERDAVLDALTHEQVDQGFGEPAIVFDSLGRYLKMKGAQTDAVNSGNWAQFGTTVAGSLSYGEGIFTRRCQALFDAMERDGVRLT